MLYPGQTGKIGGQKVTPYSQFTPEQMDLFNRMMKSFGPGLEQGMQQLSSLAGGDQEAFEALEAPALRQFSQFTGQQASRFSGAGELGARRSSGFQNTMTSASQAMAEKLQSQRLGLQRQAQQDLFGMAQDLLGRSPYGAKMHEPKKGGWEVFMENFMPLVGQALPFLL